MITYKKHRREGSVIVNQTPDEGCPYRATTCPERSRGIGSEGSLLIPDKKDFYPQRPLVPSAVEGSGAEGPIFSSHPMGPSILTGRAATAPSLREKLVDGLLVIHLSRPQN